MMRLMLESDQEANHNKQRSIFVYINAFIALTGLIYHPISAPILNKMLQT